MKARCANAALNPSSLQKQRRNLLGQAFLQVLKRFFISSPKETQKNRSCSKVKSCLKHCLYGFCDTLVSLLSVRLCGWEQGCCQPSRCHFCSGTCINGKGTEQLRMELALTWSGNHRSKCSHITNKHQSLLESMERSLIAATNFYLKFYYCSSDES